MKLHQGSRIYRAAVTAAEAADAELDKATREARESVRRLEDVWRRKEQAAEQYEAVSTAYELLNDQDQPMSNQEHSAELHKWDAQYNLASTWVRDQLGDTTQALKRLEAATIDQIAKQRAVQKAYHDDIARLEDEKNIPAPVKKRWVKPVAWTAGIVTTITVGVVTGLATKFFETVLGLG